MQIWNKKNNKFLQGPIGHPEIPAPVPAIFPEMIPNLDPVINPGPRLPIITLSPLYKPCMVIQLVIIPINMPPSVFDILFRALEVIPWVYLILFCIKAEVIHQPALRRVMRFWSLLERVLSRAIILLQQRVASPLEEITLRLIGRRVLRGVLVVRQRPLPCRLFLLRV